MLARKKHYGISALNILFFFLAVAVFDSGSISLQILGATPFVSFSILVVFSCFTRPSVSAAVGLIVGAFVDSTATGSYCFNTVLLCVLALAANLLASNVFNRNLKATVALCLILSIIYFIIYWCFFIAFSVNLSQSTQYFLGYALPSAVYTATLSIPFYFVYKTFADKKAEN